MPTRTARGLPPALSRHPYAVLRPRDAADVYVNPREEFRRLADNGVLHPLGRGYYAIVPRQAIGRPWRPEVEVAALGIGQADYGTGRVALMGASAARYHGAIPRALSVAVLAVPVQRAPHDIDGGQVVFVKRDVATLDVERATRLATDGYVTTVEQTLVDLAARPTLGGLEPAQADEAIAALAARADWDRAEVIARRLRKVTALRLARVRL